jgi:20S proteasome alpha/beta subunit
MTVCIAAISEAMLLLASDRMISAGDIEFEPPSPKIHFLTRSMCVLFSGDAALHAEVLQDLAIETNALVERAPDNWLRVREVAELYVKHRAAALRRRTSAAILAPLGLDHSSLLAQQSSLEPKFLEDVSKALIGYKLPWVSAIVAGVDMRFGQATPSIYVIHDGQIACADGVGFAAIGNGQRHAESQLMLAGYSRHTLNGDALVLLYGAKKSAEVAPGVGRETDMFALGPNVGQFFRFPDGLVGKLEDIHRKTRAAEEAVREASHAEMRNFLDQAAQNKASDQAEKPPGLTPEAG